MNFKKIVVVLAVVLALPVSGAKVRMTRKVVAEKMAARRELFSAEKRRKQKFVKLVSGLKGEADSAGKCDVPGSGCLGGFGDSADTVREVVIDAVLDSVVYILDEAAKSKTLPQVKEKLGIFIEHMLVHCSKEASSYLLESEDFSKKVLSGLECYDRLVGKQVGILLDDIFENYGELSREIVLCVQDFLTIFCDFKLKTIDITILELFMEKFGHILVHPEPAVMAPCGGAGAPARSASTGRLPRSKSFMGLPHTSPARSTVTQESKGSLDSLVGQFGAGFGFHEDIFAVQDSSARPAAPAPRDDDSTEVDGADDSTDSDDDDNLIVGYSLLRGTPPPMVVFGSALGRRPTFFEDGKPLPLRRKKTIKDKKRGRPVISDDSAGCVLGDSDSSDSSDCSDCDASSSSEDARPMKKR